MTQLKTRQQIADEMGISRKTLYRWLKKKEIKLSTGLICPHMQKFIKENLFLNESQNVP
ncbi:phBC6A51 family helix-turn-helix protein [Emticicia sp. W12TSBA100-4]|uniref:phBC6A51 family helix-turn-helix protein n=1 Tax=Emticicia sp. W12TSBA100-4 TaxID=3160965 RepID=UPI003305C180